MTSYQDRKAAAIDANECLVSGCHEPPLPDSSECERHASGTKTRQARSIAQRRLAWDAAKLCHGCGRPRAKGARYCPVCLSRGRWRYRARPVDALSTLRRDLEGDGYARQRYHGKGRRGAMTGQESDALDRRQADSSHRLGNESNDRAWSEEVQAMGRVMRDDALAAADAHYAHVIRSLLTILRRHRWSEDDIAEIVAIPSES